MQSTTESASTSLLSDLSRLFLLMNRDIGDHHRMLYLCQLFVAAVLLVIGFIDCAKFSILITRCHSDEVKVGLLHRSECLLYTPSNEHFGITPLEAMYLGRPVIAVNSGGPLETVRASENVNERVEEQTGFLCKPEPKAFAQVGLDMVKLRIILTMMPVMM